MGAAFLDLTEEALGASRSLAVVGAGITLGVLLMVGLALLLGAWGIGEGEDEERGRQSEQAADGDSDQQGLERARLIAIGEGIHNIPEALPIGAALAIAPHLGLLIALLMTVENFAESGAIAAELIPLRATTGQIYWETVWPGLLSVIGVPIGVLLAGISSTLLAPTLALAAGIMLVITVEVWSDGRRMAGANWSTIGVLVGVLLALGTSGLRLG